MDIIINILCGGTYSVVTYTVIRTIKNNFVVVAKLLFWILWHIITVMERERKTKTIINNE